MSEYESLEDLFSFLDVPNLPHMHLSESSGWIMAEFMFDVVKVMRPQLWTMAHG
jgi:hypothetical protein